MYLFFCNYGFYFFWVKLFFFFFFFGVGKYVKLLISFEYVWIRLNHLRLLLVISFVVIFLCV